MSHCEDSSYKINGDVLNMEKVEDEDARECDSRNVTADIKTGDVPYEEFRNGAGDDRVDSKGWLGAALFKTEAEDVPLAASSKMDQFAMEYKMNHGSRGLALIFNNKKFSSRLSLNERRGTEVDGKRLKKTLIHVGFLEKNIKVCNDYTAAQIKKAITEVSFGDHTHCDCLVVAVLSHGDLGYIYGIDHKFSANDLWEPFMADKCPTLAGKPKMFFIQACQGDRLDHGHVMEFRDEPDGPVQYKIPSHADFLIAYSTVPGFYSWRNTNDGSWFVQALCSVLLQYGHVEDIATVLTFVNQKVALGFESCVPQNYRMNQKKQIPCHMSMLTRKVYFRPKNVTTGTD